jgi:protein transport protein SEC61 subunit gamma-like protein
MLTHMKRFLSQCKRVLFVSSKPDKDEFIQSLKITGIGMVIIGVIGFVIFLAIQLIGGL